MLIDGERSIDEGGGLGTAGCQQLQSGRLLVCIFTERWATDVSLYHWKLPSVYEALVPLVPSSVTARLR